MIKAIIFDFFGVIRQDAFHAWMDIHGFTRGDAPGKVSRMLDTGQINVDEFYRRLGEITNQTAEKVGKEFAENEIFDQFVINIIHEIKKTYKIVLLSNSDGPYLRNILSEQGLESLFTEIFISAEIGLAKPDKEMFEFVLSKIGFQPNEVAFVDDQQKNIDAGSQLGIKGILFESANQLKEDLQRIND